MTVMNMSRNSSPVVRPLGVRAQLWGTVVAVCASTGGSGCRRVAMKIARTRVARMPAAAHLWAGSTRWGRVCPRSRLAVVLMGVPVFIVAPVVLLVSGRLGHRRGVMIGGLRRLAFSRCGVSRVVVSGCRNESAFVCLASICRLLFAAGEISRQGFQQVSGSGPLREPRDGLACFLVLYRVGGVFTRVFRALPILKRVLPN